MEPSGDPMALIGAKSSSLIGTNKKGSRLSYLNISLYQEKNDACVLFIFTSKQTGDW